MQINLAQLTSAVDKVKSLASDMKQIPGILLNIEDDKVKVCYYDGRKAVAEKVDAVVGEDEMKGSIVVQYNTFVDVISSCQPTGMISVDYIDMVVNADNTATIRVEKKLTMRRSEDDEDEYTRIVSKMKQNISWSNNRNDVKHAILYRLDYDKLFNTTEIVEGGSTPEVWDEWEKSSFLSVLQRISCDDGKTCYISSKRKGGFVANVAFLSFISCEEANNGAIVAPTRLAKQIYDVVAKCGSDTVLVGTNKVYCTVVDSENRMALWFEMPQGDRMSLEALEKYLSKSYQDLCSVFYRPALENVIKCCIASSKNTESAKMKFHIGDETTVSFRTSGGNSADDDFSVVSEQLFGNKAEEIANADGLNINLGTLATMLKNCKNDYIMLCIDLGADVKVLNVADIKGKDEAGNIKVDANYFTILL